MKGKGSRPQKHRNRKPRRRVLPRDPYFTRAVTLDTTRTAQLGGKLEITGEAVVIARSPGVVEITRHSYDRLRHAITTNSLHAPKVREVVQFAFPSLRGLGHQEARHS